MLYGVIYSVFGQHAGLASRPHMCLSLCLVGLLSACTSGGSDNVTVASANQAEDPVVVEIPLAYILRPLPDEAPDLRDPLQFNPGARLLLAERAAVSAEVTDITPLIAEVAAAEEGRDAQELAIDIKDLEASYDGSRLIFAARVVPEPVDNNLENTTWNLWELDLQTLQPSYLIPSRIKRNEGMDTGGGHDLAPHYLTDDRIVFTSTRQVASQARQLNEGRGQIFAALDEDRGDPAAVLHIYDPQARVAEFTQISFNLSHDLDPMLHSSGEILFSRWNNTTTDHFSLYRIHPDGEGLAPVYGFHSQNIGSNGIRLEFTQPREADDGQLLSLVRAFSTESLGGDITVIDVENWAEINQPVSDSPDTAGTGQHPLTQADIRTDNTLSPGGRYTSLYPLRDGSGRLLVSWSECRALDDDNNVQPCSLAEDTDMPASPLYGGWIYDPASNTQRPVVSAQEGFMVSEIIAAEPRAFPPLLGREDSYNADLAVNNRGQLLIESVYDLDGADVSPAGIANHAEPGTEAYTMRPARFLRVYYPVPLPDDDVLEIPRYAFGVSRGFGFREIAGYVPVEPDGSATLTVQAQRPFSFSVLDANGRRIGARHDYWLQLAPGEVMHCSGCHTRGSTVPHGHISGQPQTSNPGAGALASGNTGFPGTDINTLYATEVGQSMAGVWDFHRPLGNAAAADRKLSLELSYTDEWSGPGVTPDASITDRAYDPEWSNVPVVTPLVVNSLDPSQPSRIVINYVDHIQPIWERHCTVCHTSTNDTVIPPGQLDLSASSSDLDPDHYRSYRELLSVDTEQWINTAGNPADRVRTCTDTDEEDNLLTFNAPLNIQPSMRAGSANASSGFFACFEGGTCGPNGQPPLPANCTEEGGTVVLPTSNTVDHGGLLSPSEMRLISEWLDLGAQYYNNPFDSRLQQ